jgi:hypothetical protein
MSMMVAFISFWALVMLVKNSKVWLNILVPMIVVAVLLGFPENRTHFVYPVIASVSFLGIVSLFLPGFRSLAASPILLAFWTAPLCVVWLISERKEDRSMSQVSLTILIALSFIAGVVLLRLSEAKSAEKSKIHWAIIVAAVLTWCVTFFSGRGGGADNMMSTFSLFGLSKEATWALIVAFRKVVHVTFYSSLAISICLFLREQKTALRPAVFQSLFIAFGLAICDEWRQNMMPNREGSIRDVTLDIVGASIVIWLFVFKPASRLS